MKDFVERFLRSSSNNVVRVPLHLLVCCSCAHLGDGECTDLIQDLFASLCLILCSGCLFGSVRCGAASF